jgi:hypothetical protein
MPAYHIARSFLGKQLLEDACPYTWRSKRKLLMIGLLQEDAEEARSFLIGRARWKGEAFPGESTQQVVVLLKPFTKGLSFHITV